MGSNDHVDVPDPAMTIAGNCERVMGYCKAATKEPWKVLSSTVALEFEAPDGSTVCDWDSRGRSEEPSEEDCRFMTDSRTDLPRFVRAVEYAFKRIDDLAQGDDENFWHWGNGAREELTRILNGEEVEQ